jgi:hypothetical protein
MFPHSETWVAFLTLLALEIVSVLYRSYAGAWPWIRYRRWSSRRREASVDEVTGIAHREL